MSTEFNPMTLPVGNELSSLFDRDASLVMFDIGSCDGLDAIRYSKTFPNAKVFAFEPIPQNFASIKKNVDEQHAKNVTPFNVAMSAEQGFATMFVSSRENKENQANADAGNKSSSLLPPDKHLEVYPDVSFSNSIQVPTDTIDNFCKSNNISAIDFIHLDVQGAELMVLKGASDFLSKIKVLWMEVEHIPLYKDQPLRREVETFMKQNDFVLTKFRVGGFSGDQLYIHKNYILERSGNSGYWSAKLKSKFYTNPLYIVTMRYARKLKFLLKIK